MRYSDAKQMQMQLRRKTALQNERGVLVLFQCRSRGVRGQEDLKRRALASEYVHHTLPQSHSKLQYCYRNLTRWTTTSRLEIAEAQTIEILVSLTLLYRSNRQYIGYCHLLTPSQRGRHRFVGSPALPRFCLEPPLP